MAKQMNVYNYFHGALGVKPDDTTLSTLPVDSNCGDDCRKVIDAAAAFLACAAMAKGDGHCREEIVGMTNDIVETYWRG